MRATKPDMLYLIVVMTVMLCSMLIAAIRAIQTQNIKIFFSAGLLAGVLFSLPWIVAHWRFKKRLARIKQLSLFDDVQPPFQPDYRWLRIAIVVAAVPILFGIYSALESGNFVRIIPVIWIGSLLSFPFIVFFQNSRFESIESSEVNNSGWVDYSSNHRTAIRSFKSQSSFDQTFSPSYRSFAQNIYHNRH